MDLEQAIRSRRAVREYTDETVPKRTLLKLIDSAIQAPSAVNEQPWLFTVVEDKALLERISSAAKAHALHTPPIGLDPRLRERLERVDFDIFYHAPALILISGVTASHWTVEDCSLAAENLMLAACAAGLGSCWIGFAQYWLATPQGKAMLRLPQASQPVAPIIVGHPRTLPAAVPRQEPRIEWIGP